MKDKGSVSRIEIEVHNTSQHDIALPNRTPLGRLQLVKSGVGDEGLCQESDNAVSEVDMTGLTREQEEEVRQMLKEEAASFAKNEDDIGCMEDLQMDIELSDSTPVQRNYVSIPRPPFIKK